MMKCHTILNSGNIWCCFQIKKKYSYPAAAEEERAFPEGLMKFVTRSGFFRRGLNKDSHLDPDTIQIISKMPCNVQCGYYYISFQIVLINYISATSLFQRAVWFMLDAACQGPTLHFLQEISGCQTAE